jgi:two-component sensor histidine kinase
MRKALEQAWTAEKSKSLLLEELAHRMKNNLASVGSLLRLQARHRPELEEAFCSAAGRVEVMASVHDFLRMREGCSIDVGDYITELCQKLGDTLRGVRPIAVIVHAQRVEFPAERAVPIGIIVNELVTNSLKYAFPDDRNGIIEVDIQNSATEVIVSVADNGVGCMDEPKGLGSTLVQLMANQLQGSIQREYAKPGCRVVLRLPYEQRRTM